MHWILIIMGSLGRVLPGRGTIFQLWDSTLAAAWGREAGTPAAGFQAGGDGAVTELGEMAGSHQPGNILF